MPITPDELRRVLLVVKQLQELLEGLEAQAQLDVAEGPARDFPTPRLDRIP